MRGRGAESVEDTLFLLHNGKNCVKYRKLVTDIPKNDGFRQFILRIIADGRIRKKRKEKGRKE